MSSASFEFRTPLTLPLPSLATRGGSATAAALEAEIAARKLADSLLEVPFNFSDDITTSAPPTGCFKLNHATAALANIARINKTDAGGVSRAILIPTWKQYPTDEIQGHLKITNSSGANRWVEYVIIDVVDAGAFFTVHIRHVAEGQQPFIDGLEAKLRYLVPTSGDAIHAIAKTIPDNADIVGLLDSTDSFRVRKFTWGNARAAQWAALGPLIAVATAKTTPVDNDDVPLSDSEDSNATKRLSWANLKATLRTYFNSFYAPLASPAFTGNPTAPTQAVDNDSTRLATTAFAHAVVDLEASSRVAAVEKSAARILGGRPGDVPKAFTSQTLGEFDNVVSIDDVPIIDTEGSVIRIVGAAIIAPCDAFRVEPGRRYKIRAVVRRRGNTPDPANDSVRLALRWLGASKTALISTAIIDDLLTLTTASGRVEVSGIVAAAAGSGVDFVAPPSAVYGRPYVQTFGTVPTTDIEVIEVLDITDSEFIAPDLTALDARVAAIETEELPDRVEVLEAASTGAEIARFKTRDEAAAQALLGTIPATVDVLETLSVTATGAFVTAIYDRIFVEPAGGDYFPDDDGSFWRYRLDDSGIRTLQTSEPDTFPNIAVGLGAGIAANRMLVRHDEVGGAASAINVAASFQQFIRDTSRPPSAQPTCIRGFQQIDAGVAVASSFAISGELTSHTSAGAALGLAATSGVAQKYGTATVFGMHGVAVCNVDAIATPTNVTSIIGAEFGTKAAGLDHPTSNPGPTGFYGSRRTVQIVPRSNPTVSATVAGETGVGLDIRTDAGATGGYYRYALVIRELASNPNKIGTALEIDTSGPNGILIRGNQTNPFDLYTTAAPTAKIGSEVSTNATRIADLDWTGHTSTGERRTYARDRSVIVDNTNGAEKGRRDFITIQAGVIALEGSFYNGLVLGSAGGGAMGLGTINVPAAGYHVAGTKVLGARGAAVADATDAATAITQLNALLARCRAHGIIA